MLKKSFGYLGHCLMVKTHQTWWSSCADSDVIDGFVFAVWSTYLKTFLFPWSHLHNELESMICWCYLSKIPYLTSCHVGTDGLSSLGCYLWSTYLSSLCCYQNRMLDPLPQYDYFCLSISNPHTLQMQNLASFDGPAHYCLSSVLDYH